MEGDIGDGRERGRVVRRGWEEGRGTGERVRVNEWMVLGCGREGDRVGRPWIEEDNCTTDVSVSDHLLSLQSCKVEDNLRLPKRHYPMASRISLEDSWRR